MGSRNASRNFSSTAMSELQQKIADLVMADPAVASVGSTVGGSAWSGSVHRGRLVISLQPPSERGVAGQRRAHPPRPTGGNPPGHRQGTVPAPGPAPGA